MAVSFFSGGNWSTRRKPRPVENHRQTLSHNVVYKVHLAISGIRTHNLSDYKHQITK